MTWQPMATAPRDGTLIEIFDGVHGHMLARYDAENPKGNPWRVAPDLDAWFGEGWAAAWRPHTNPHHELDQFDKCCLMLRPESGNATEADLNWPDERRPSRGDEPSFPHSSGVAKAEGK